MSIGTVYQRKDGYWVACVTVAGKRVVKYGKTKREAQQRLAELIGGAQAGTLAAPTRLTLAAWAGQWLDGLEGTRRPSTVHSYRAALRPLVERLGAVRLDKLTAHALALTFTALRRAGNGTRRIQQSYVVLGICLRQAVRLGILGSNPLARVDKPEHAAGERRWWSEDETRRFLAAAESSRLAYAPLLTFMVGTGLRVGEALGLRWSDVGFEWRAVSVLPARGSATPNRRALPLTGHRRASPRRLSATGSENHPSFCTVLLTPARSPQPRCGGVHQGKRETLPTCDRGGAISAEVRSMLDPRIAALAAQPPAIPSGSRWR